MKKISSGLLILSVVTLMFSGCASARNRNNSSSSLEDGLARYELLFDIDDAESMGTVLTMMNKRLKDYGFTSHQVISQGKHTIKVSFFGKSEMEKNLVARYLAYDGKVAITNSKNTYAFADEFLDSNKPAYYVQEYDLASVVIPIDKNNQYFRMVYQEALNMVYEGTGEFVIEYEDEDSEEEHNMVRTALLYLWYNYVPNQYSYARIDANNTEAYDPQVASQVFMTFNAACPFLDDDGNALKAIIKPNINSDEITKEEIEQSIMLAKYYVAIINAKPLNCVVSLLPSTSI